MTIRLIHKSVFCYLHMFTVFVRDLILKSAGAQFLSCYYTTGKAIIQVQCLTGYTFVIRSL